MMWHWLGDSYLNQPAPVSYRALVANPNVSMTFDGVGSSSLQDQAARYALTPEAWDRMLVVNDGGLSDSAANAAAALSDMLSNILDPTYMLYLEPPYTAGMGFDNPTVRASRDARLAAIRAVVGDSRYVETYAAYAAAAISDPDNPGYAQDQADVANGVIPASCLNDPAHINPKGRNALVNGALMPHIANNGWIFTP